MEDSVTPHLDDGLIHELVDGEIDSTRLGAIQAHLSECERCRSRLDQARDAAGLADSLLEMLDPEEAAGTDPEVIPISPRVRPHWSRNLAWAASLILAAGLGYVGRGEFLPPQPQATESTAPDGATVPADVIRDESAQPAPEEETPAVAATPPAEVRQRVVEPGPPPTATAMTDRVPIENPEAERRDQPSRAMEMAGRGFEDAAVSTRGARAAAPQALAAGAAAKADQRSSTVVDLPTAMVTLGGSIRLIDGMVPERLEQLGDTVAVIYRAMDLTLRLRQYPIGTDLSWSLEAPAEFPADSLAALRARVK